MKNFSRKIFTSYTSKKQTEETKNAFYTWLLDESEQAEKEIELDKIWNEPTQMSTKDVSKALYRFKKSMNPVKLDKVIWLWRSIAASLLIASSTLAYLLINSAGFQATDIIEQYTQVSDVDMITLPDGTVVYTNSQTILLYPSKFTGDTRSVYLAGEAMFKVAKDKKHPFIVKTSDINITALGTEFNVLAYPEDSVVYATLLEGSIRIDKPGTDLNTVLSPNDQLTYYRNGQEPKLTTVDSDVITSWIDGEITIQNKRLVEIFHSLERHYGVKFNYDSEIVNDKYKYTFKFKRDTPFSDVAKIIKAVSNINYEIEGNICYIK